MGVPVVRRGARRVVLRSVVRDLVVSQLGGSITMGAADGRGTVVDIRLPPGR